MTPNSIIAPFRWLSARWSQFTQDGLTRVLESAARLTIDDGSRLVFFSDLHRGDNSLSDAFRHNAELFLQALTDYYTSGFTYVEVGDGDELWANRNLGDVERAHAPVFGLLNLFNQGGRLHLLLGNHELRRFGKRRQVRSGIVAREGLVLEHTRTGREILVAHGHQVDVKNSRFYWVGLAMVRWIVRPMQRLGLLQSLPPVDGPLEEEALIIKTSRWARLTQRLVERRIKNWIRRMNRAVIAGHTHLPRLPEPGAPPYFNTGAGVNPGFITGIEIQGSEIMLVRWAWDEAHCAVRTIIGQPLALDNLG